MLNRDTLDIRVAPEGLSKENAKRICSPLTVDRRRLVTSGAFSCTFCWRLLWAFENMAMVVDAFVFLLHRSSIIISRDVSLHTRSRLCSRSSDSLLMTFLIHAGMNSPGGGGVHRKLLQLIIHWKDNDDALLCLKHRQGQKNRVIKSASK